MRDETAEEKLGGSPYSVDPEAAGGLGLTPRLTPETEAEIARAFNVAPVKDVELPTRATREGETTVGTCVYCDASVYGERFEIDHDKACPWLALPALLAELQAVRKELDALDTWGRRLMAVEQERRIGLAGLDELQRLSEAATPGEWQQRPPNHRQVQRRGRTADEPAIALYMIEADAQLSVAAVNYVRAMHARNNPLDTHANPK